MFEERLRDILTTVYTGRVIVFSTVTARETLFSKGLSPAIFLHKYYAQYIGESRVSFTIKDKIVKDMCQLTPIDVEEIDCYKQDKMNKIIRDKIVSKSKLPKELSKDDLSSKQLIENYLKSLNFFWFEEATRIFLYCLSLDENNFKFSTLQQPLGLTFLIEIGPGVNVKAEYEKVRKQVDIKIKKWFAFNPSRTKNLPILVILLYNSEKGGSLNEMRILHDTLKSQYNLQSGLICLVEINGVAAKDSIEWSSYPRPVIKHDYKLQPSDPIRLIGDNEDFQLKQYVTNHREKIRMSLDDRLRWLGVRYEQNNTTKNRFFNFFKGQEVDRSYTAEEAESREIADLLFLLGEYKRSLQIYKSLTEKFSGANRQPQIYSNTSEMVQLGKYMCAITGGDKDKAYDSIQKYADKRLFKQIQTMGKVKIFRYLIYMMYFIHGLRNFNRQFIKGSYYYYIKRCVNEETSSENNAYPSLIPTLVHEQYANLNLLYPIPQVRRYAYDVIRVSTKFNEYRLFDHHLRCFLIASYIYQNSFPSIQKYINSTLSRTYLELKKYRFSVERIQHTWKALLKIYQDTPTQNQEENQFTKLYNSQLRLVSEIERVQPLELTRQTEDCIPVPKITDVLVEIRDQALDTGEGIGSKWQEVGDVFLGEPQLTSKGMSKQNMLKMLKLFDALSPQQKQLAYRVRNLPSGTIPEAILKRNARQAFVGEPIIVSFDMKNFLPLTIEVTHIQLHLKVVRKCTMTRLDPIEDKLILKHGQKSTVTFQLIPQEEGLYELSHISWTFFKMKSIHRFKEPWEAKSSLKSMYFKLNVLEGCGQLSAAVKQGHKFYEGQSDELQLLLTNVGKQPIEELYLSVENQQIFGFKMKWLDLQIPPTQTVTTKLGIKMPVLKSSDFLKCINKAIILYRTGSAFRVQRVVNTFNVHRVVEILNLSCERISTTLHFLSFSLKHQAPEQQQLNLLKSMVISKGMDIKKIETNNLGTLTHYFFFMRKHQETDLEEYQFSYHDFPSKNIIKQTYLSKLQTPKPTDQESDADYQNDSTLKLFFLWWDKEGKCGVIDPEPIAITATENSSSLLKLPFNAKVHLDDEIECNFQENVYAQVEVQFIIKNIFNVKDINLTVQFIEGTENDFFWEGVTERHLCLKFNGEHKMKLRLLATRPGLFNVSKSIKYTIMLNKSNSYVRYHSEYQNIYLVVNGPKASQTAFDFFQQMPPVAFKKSHEQESLI